MLSSTSSSNQRLPPGPWGRTWLLVAMLVVVAVGGVEAFWRSRGFRPELRDDVDLWASALDKVHKDDPRQVVFIGSSRLRLAINTDVFTRTFGGPRPVQLAVDGSSCMPVLRYLSNLDSFRGVLVCDAMPWFFYPKLDDQAGTQGEYVRTYENQTVCQPFERALRAEVRDAFAFRDVEVQWTVNNLLVWIKTRRLPKEKNLGHITLMPDRSKLSDYRKADVASILHWFIETYGKEKTPATPEQFEKDLNTIEQMVAKIRQRHGQVVFVTFPSSGEVRQLEVDRFPRRLYWDKLCARIGVPCIYYADYPQLAKFICPDGSHLDYRDGAVFTEEFAKILKDKLRAAGATADSKPQRAP